MSRRRSVRHISSEPAPQRLIEAAIANGPSLNS